MEETVACNLTKKFEIDIRELSYGWETIELRFDSESILYKVSYIGSEPLGTLINSVVDMQDVEDDKYHIHWEDEPGRIELLIEKKNYLVDITVKKEETLKTFTMSFSLYRDTIVQTGLKTLKKYGIRGFNDNWNRSSPFDYFPINNLLFLLGGNLSSVDTLDEVYSNVFDELDLLMRRLKEV